MNRNSNEYEAQLARVLEIEGLLLLSRERGESSPELVRRLLAEKTAALAAAFALTGRSDAPALGPEQAEAAAAEFEEEGLAVGPDPEPEPEPEPEPKPEAAPVPEVQPRVTVADSIARKQARKMAGAIALVDRFRFRRDLFDNSDEEMNRALEMIDSMADASEAREFLLNDLCWDPEQPSAADFLKLVDNHFSR